MPAYNATAPDGNTPVQLLQPAAPVPGPPGYAFGSKPLNVPTTLMQVTAVAKTGGTATVNVAVREGNIPASGSLVTITGTQVDSTFNVTNVALTAVTIDSGTGIGTIQFALSGTVAKTPDAGQAYVPVPEVPEALTGSDQKSKQFALSGLGVSWEYSCPSAPASISIQLEGAINDVDAEYTIIGSAQTGVSGAVTVIGTVPELVHFVRLHVTASSGGTLPTIIGKIQAT